MDSQDLEEGPLEVELVVREADGTERVLWAGELPATGVQVYPTTEPPEWAAAVDLLPPHKPGDRYILGAKVTKAHR